MTELARSILVACVLAALIPACASGRVRGGQGTEMRQAEEYEPERKVDPPEGNVSRQTDTYPLLEVDLERREPPAGPPLGPEPEPSPTGGSDPEKSK